MKNGTNTVLNRVHFQLCENFKKYVPVREKGVFISSRVTLTNTPQFFKKIRLQFCGAKHLAEWKMFGINTLRAYSVC